MQIEFDRNIMASIKRTRVVFGFFSNLEFFRPLRLFKKINNWKRKCFDSFTIVLAWSML